MVIMSVMFSSSESMLGRAWSPLARADDHGLRSNVGNPGQEEPHANPSGDLLPQDQLVTDVDDVAKPAR